MALVVVGIDYHRWRRLAGPFLVVALLLLALVLVPGVGVDANGSTRWLGVGPLTIQPSEVVKLALLVWVADLLARRVHAQHRATLRPVVVVLAAAATLVMLQPNLGTTIVIAGIALALCFVAEAPAGRWRAGPPSGWRRRPAWPWPRRTAAPVC